MWIGVDPGVGGGMAVIERFVDADLQEQTGIACLKFKDATEADISNFVLSAITTSDGPKFALIEKVASSPQMGVVSAFTFGRSYGFLRGLLIAHGIPFDDVRPQLWQKTLGCLSHGDKNTTKSKAQQLFPKERITHANADALLIAEYCRRTYTLT